MLAGSESYNEKTDLFTSYKISSFSSRSSCASLLVYTGSNTTNICPSSIRKRGNGFIKLNAQHERDMQQISFLLKLRLFCLYKRAPFQQKTTSLPFFTRSKRYYKTRIFERGFGISPMHSSKISDVADVLKNCLVEMA